jgi:hypothetical protein
MRKWLIGLMAALILVFAVVAPAFALDKRQGGRIYIAPNETITDDLLLTGDTIAIDGIVDGDVYAFGSYIEVRGTIKGNLITAGNTVHLLGNVTGSVFAAANDVSMEGRIDGGLVTAGSITRLTGIGSVGRSWITAADQVILGGKVERGLLIGASRANIAGQVGKELEAYVGSLTVSNTANVADTVTYYSGEKASIDPAAHTGAVMFHRYDTTNWQGVNRWFHTTWIALKFIGFMLAGLLILALFPALRRRFPELVAEKPWQLPVAGLVTLVLFPIAVVILLMTVIGIPVGLMGMVFFPGLIYFSQILVSWTLGKLLEERASFMNGWSWPLIFLVGAVLTTLLAQIPGMGWFFGLAWLLYGLGGLYYLIARRPAAA